MSFTYTSQHIFARPLVFLSAASMLLLFAMVEAEENNNIYSPHRVKTGSGDNKEDGSPDCLAGLGVNFPGYYSLELLPADLLPIDLLLPEKATGTTTTTVNPVNADVVSTGAGKRRNSTSRYPIDWAAVAEAYYRSINFDSREIQSPATAESAT